jgi:hypothetical protein
VTKLPAQRALVTRTSTKGPVMVELMKGEEEKTKIRFGQSLTVDGGRDCNHRQTFLNRAVRCSLRRPAQAMPCCPEISGSENSFGFVRFALDVPRFAVPIPIWVKVSFMVQ